MFRNYLITTLRTFRKNRAFTFINLMGITLGMASFILIMKYVSNELSYDQFHSKKNRVYRVQLDRYNQGEVSTQWAAGCAGVGPAMLETFPEVQSFVKMHSSNAMVSYGEQVFREDKFFYASEDFFEVFDLIEHMPGTEYGLLTMKKIQEFQATTEFKRTLEPPVFYHSRSRATMYLPNEENSPTKLFDGNLHQ